MPSDESKPNRVGSSFEERSSGAIRASAISSDIVRPAYDSFCFAHLPGLCETVLLGNTARMSFPKELQSAVGRFDHVVFCFFDAFGWRSFERFRETSPLLKAVDQQGITLKTTSQFPSTTAVHVTTEVTGKPFFEHAVCGWDYFEPRVGRMIKPLRFSFSEDGESGTLLKAGLKPESVLPGADLLPSLIQKGVTVYRHGPEAYFPSPYNSSFCPLSSIKGYSSLDSGVKSVQSVIDEGVKKSYQVLYTDDYDIICHKQGVVSDDADRVAQATLRSLESFLNWSPKTPTLLILTADHGQITTSDAGTINILTLVPDIREYLKKDARGLPIRFSGGSRNLFLHVREDCIDQLSNELRQRLAGAATVMTVPEACQAGMLGVTRVSEGLSERLGTLLVIPHRGYVVGWIEPPEFSEAPFSNHGGASPEEMETPLLLLPLS
jgi:hypothetical protein